MSQATNPFNADLHRTVLNATYPGDGLPPENRGSWYCPTVNERQAKALARLLDEHHITRVYDLGAGDLRLSIWLASRGYDVMAYETIREITNVVSWEFDLSDIELRNRDYYKDWFHISADRAAFVAFGAKNDLPDVPQRGLAISGYSEIGWNAWLDGRDISDRWEAAQKM